ncbi:MAG: glycosyltransferase family 39 protein [Elusimicrobiota bacterium]
MATDFYLHSWDERYHALVAKNLIKHPLIPTLYDKPVLPYDYKNWTGNHIWVHKQPLPLWTMAVSLWLFGINEIALRIPSIILSTIGIWLIYLIGRNLFDKKVGFIAAFLYSIHGLIIEMTGGRVATDHIDIFFLFFVELAVLFAVKFAQNKKIIYNFLCGISVGAAILSKWLPALIVLPLWFLFVIDSKKFTSKEILVNFILLCLMVLITFVPWQLYIYNIFPLEAKWESAFNLKHITEVLDKLGGPFYYHFGKIRIIFGELSYLPIVWFMWETVKNRRDYKRLALAVWFLIPYLFFSFAKTKMQGYILFTAPAVFIITAVFWNYLYSRKHIIKYKRLTYTILFLLIALPVRYSIERIKPFKIRERSPIWASEIKNLKNQFEGNNIILFNSEHPIETMFYTDIIAYPHIPDKIRLSEIIGKGYKVLINDNGHLDNDIKTMSGIQIVKLTAAAKAGI